MKILSIDPGTVQSAFVLWDGETILDKGIFENNDILEYLKFRIADLLVIEKVASYGMAVGESTFETVFWSGRFAQAWPGRIRRTTRGDVKMHLCGSMRAKDGNVRQALIDRLGAPGTKKNPGLTYGCSKDVWAALALAVTTYDQEGKK